MIQSIIHSRLVLNICTTQFRFGTAIHVQNKLVKRSNEQCTETGMNELIEWHQKRKPHSYLVLFVVLLIRFGSVS